VDVASDRPFRDEGRRLVGWRRIRVALCIRSADVFSSQVPFSTAREEIDFSSIFPFPACFFFSPFFLFFFSFIFFFLFFTFCFFFFFFLFCFCLVALFSWVLDEGH